MLQVKRPRKDLDDEQEQHSSSKTKKEPLSEQLKYCAVVLPSGELTLDHVIPRSRGGNSTWENLVACCHACNRRKGNRMLHELDDMILMRDPRPFSLHTSRQIMRMLGRGDDRWRKYLFY